MIACDSHHDSSQDDNDHPPHQDLHPTQYSLPISIISNQTTSTNPCHTHTLTYLTTRTSPSPHTYSLLRRASIRTISSELLPRGLSSGPLSFGDPIAGYTIAYIFRVPDPLARGNRRTHALLALAGKDASRAFRASPCVWRAFERIAGAIVGGAERVAEANTADEDASSPRTCNSDANSDANAKRHPHHHKRTFTPVSSFLSGRRMDPDGYPISKANLWGRSPQKSLAELVGNEYLFAELHAEFVALLQTLGRGFGGVPVDDDDGVLGGVGGEGGQDDQDGEEDEEVQVEVRERAAPRSPTHDSTHNQPRTTIPTTTNVTTAAKNTTTTTSLLPSPPLSSSTLSCTPAAIPILPPRQ